MSVAKSQKPLFGLLGFISEKANPLLVRTLRQMLRSKAFVSLFNLALLGGTLAAVLVAAFSDFAEEGRAALMLFGVLTGIWSLILLIVLPFFSFKEVTREKDENVWDLMELTGMEPGQLLRGWMFSSLTQAALFGSAIAPFMMMAYLLRGLDLGVIFFTLVFIPMLGILLSSFSMFLACLGHNKATRHILQLLLAIVLIGCWVSLAGYAQFLVLFGVINNLTLGLLDGSLETWIGVGIYFNIWLATVVLFLVLSATLLTFKADNRSTKPRALWYILFFNGALVFTFAAHFFPYSEWKDGLSAFSVFGASWAVILGLFSITENQKLSPRQARYITKPSKILKPFVGILGPGAARGRLAFLAMACLALLAGAIPMIFSSSAADYQKGMVNGAWGLICYASIYFVISEFIARRVFYKFFSSAPLRRCLVLLILLLLTISAILILVISEVPDWESNILSYIIPFYGMIHFFDATPENQPYLYVVSAFGLLSMLALALQSLKLNIETLRVRAEADTNPRS